MPKLTRRSLLKGIAALPVVATLVHEALKPVITGLDMAAPGADFSSAAVRYRPSPLRYVGGYFDHRVLKQLEPGLNAAFKAEYDRLGPRPLEDLFDA